MDVNQEEFRGFSYVNPDFGKWTVSVVTVLPLCTLFYPDKD